jgi:hypothetical protein
MIIDAQQNVSEIGVRVNAVLFAGGHERVQHGEVLACTPS